MAVKSEQSTGGYYKKLGDTAFTKRQFDKAAAHYVKGLQAYPFISVMRNAKATLKHISSPELGTILSDLERNKIQFLTERAQRFIEILRGSGDKGAPPLSVKEEFYKYPFTLYADIVGNIQKAIGEHYLQTRNPEAKQLFYSLGKYNPNSPKLKPLVEMMFQELQRVEKPEQAMYDLMNLLKDFHELIEEKLPEIAKSIKDILENSIDFNERRWAIFTLQALGEKNLNLIQDSLKTLHLYLNDPQAILEGIRKRVLVMKNPLIEIRIDTEGVQNPHIWVLDAGIDTIGSLAPKYPIELEYFIPVIIKQFKNGNLYTKKKCVRALVNFKNAGIDISRYLPAREIGEFHRLLGIG